MSGVPLFYFSPSVLFLDDNKIFLSSLSDYLADDYNVATTSSPSQFIEILERACIRKELLFLIHREDDYFSEQSMVSINLQSLAPQVVEIFRRCEPISVAFIDFEMPKEDGLDVCKKIAHVETKKVFLTGKLDEIGAVNAFNKGLITSYLSKNSNNMIDQIKVMVKKLHTMYLDELRNIFLPFIIKNSKLLSLYENPYFGDFFSKTIHQNSVNQSCIYELSGSQLLRNKAGDFLTLNVYEQQEIEELVLPHLEENFEDQELKKNLQDFKFILDFKNPDNTEIPPLEKWEPFITKDFSIIETENTRYFLTVKSLNS